MTEPSPRAVVVGWPIRHSRSPIIHNYWLKQHGLAGVYEALAVEPGTFPAFAASIGSDGLRGGNVTLPHKPAAFAACDVLTDVAKALGAVNTLWRENGRLNGDNTDVAGFLANLGESAPGWDDGREALVLGAGGAARAVIYGLLKRGLARIVIANRTPENAAALAAQFGPAVRAAPADAAQIASADLIVNTTSLGMAGQPALTLDLAPAKSSAVVADIVYVPLETPLLADARQRGLRTVGGLGMLLHQAAPGFERWFGVRPKVDATLRALVEADVRRTS
jgi:shikimate dehydrogenase